MIQRTGVVVSLSSRNVNSNNNRANQGGAGSGGAIDSLNYYQRNNSPLMADLPSAGVISTLASNDYLHRTTIDQLRSMNERSVLSSLSHLTTADLRTAQLYDPTSEQQQHHHQKSHRSNHQHQNSPDGQNAKPYKCTQCSKTFANSSYLSQHTRIHLGIKPYRCEICQRKFTQLSHLQQHIRTHTGDKPYKCRHAGCPKAFSQLSNLQSHSRCHQTDKPFKCNSCYKCFTDELTLLEHIPRHKDSKHLKTHICNLCGKSYTQETYLQKHLQKHAEKAEKQQQRHANSSVQHHVPAGGIGLSEDLVIRQTSQHHHQQQHQQQQNSPNSMVGVNTSAYDVKTTSAFTPINTAPPHLQAAALAQQRPPAAAYLYQQNAAAAAGFPTQLISLHQIRNYAHQPGAAAAAGLLASDHLLGLSVTAGGAGLKDKTQ
uniref:C2H2-type domain-containing protein n=1 Tax=Glossina palpalis gambiensis TaxID=67801 RepID=A0A1B0C6W4_9MUSC